MARTTARVKLAAKTVTAKALERKRSPTTNEEGIDLSDMPELTPEQIASARRRNPAGFMQRYSVFPLEGLRKAHGRTQVELARAAEMTQPEIARLEARQALEGVRIETLRRYIEALGGTLDLVATFPKTGHRMAIGGAPYEIED